MKGGIIVKSFRLRVAGALGLAFFPIPWDLFHLVIPPAYAEAPAKAPPRTWSRSKAVRLPIQLDDRLRATLSEIKLYVKTSGQEWTLVQSAPANQASFDFRAEKDGEYAFMFVTVDKSGHSMPSDLDSRPPHQVIVL